MSAERSGFKENVPKYALYGVAGLVILGFSIGLINEVFTLAA